MIKSLQIDSYKLFEQLTLPKLGRLNLFSGKNNTGKSCLLEAVGLYAGRAPIPDIVNAASSRSSERLNAWDADGITEAGTSLLHPVFDLFHRESGFSKGTIEIKELDGGHPLKIEQRIHNLVVDDDGIRRYLPAQPGDVVQGLTEMALRVFRGTEQVALLTRRNLPLRGASLLYNEKFNFSDARVVAHLPANGFSELQAAAMWDALVQGPGQDLVLNWLKIIEPSIQDLVYISGRLDSRIALVRMEETGRIPLRALGDGLTRLFHIGLAMASASHGVLLIDEFENGLHWSTQNSIWHALAEAANRFDVQIFCTTHSRDCVRAFVNVAKGANATSATIYRLERYPRCIFANELPIENVAAAIDEDGEVR
jgi:hypothetical protein